MPLSTARIEAVRAQYNQAEQGHVFQFWNQLSDQEQEPFLHQLESIDPLQLNAIYTQAKAHVANASMFSHLAPLSTEEVMSTLTASPAMIDEWRCLGLEAISKNQVAVILLAGGQGTRLGSLLPKGCYRDVGLPSHKTLFQLQSERIQKLQELATEYRASTTLAKNGLDPNATAPLPPVIIPWCIMTSGPTRTETEQFLKDHKYFGLDKENVWIFEQGTIPCFDRQGKFILDQKSRVSTSPNGNGGLYLALQTEGVLAKMEERGIMYTHCYSVDNILIRIGDPIAVGHMIQAKADATAKVMPKTMPSEPLGVICKLDGKIKVVEYSEMDPALAALTDPATGELVYRAGNVCNQMCTVSFLKRIAGVLQNRDQDLLAYHLASKKIPHIDLATGDKVTPATPNGVKLELFVFDVFPLAGRFATLEVERSREFSPMKNASGLDSPSTSRRDLERLHLRWIKESGGTVEGDSVEHHAEGHGVSEHRIGFEIGPKLSYAGEGLEWVKGKTIKARNINSVEEVQFV